MSEQTVTSAPEWDTADRMRKALRMSDVGVQEIADYLGVARNTVSTWINGRIDPSRQTIRLWALRTGVSYEWLSTGQSDTGGDSGPQGATTQPYLSLRTDGNSVTYINSHPQNPSTVDLSKAA